MDFREAIRKNNFRTKLVIISYILIMLVIGLLADIATHAEPSLDFSQNMLDLIMLKQLPVATAIILSITFIGLIYIHYRGHKMMLAGLNAKQLSPNEQLTAQERQLCNIIEELSLSASLGYIPHLYLLDSDEPNAFAAGWSAQNALVGITTGLIERLNRQEIQAVLAHEIGHIIHGDSKLTLYVGILANVILTITNIFSQFVVTPSGNGRDRNDAANKARLILLILNFILPVVTKVLYFYLSRTREYMADAAAVELTQDNKAMISALMKISNQHQIKDYTQQSTGSAYRQAAYIFNKGDSIFSTHPSIENRIAALKDEKKF